jgi:glycosyltransferase involved in cell wall biosynthesis
VDIAQVLSASTGGIGRHVASIAPRLVAQGHRVRVFCPEATAVAQGFRELGLEVLPLTALSRAGRADVLHAHGYKAGGLSLPVARLGRRPMVVTWHNAVLGTGRSAVAGHLLQRLVARGADLTLGASTDLVSEAVRLGARSARLAPVAAPALPPATTTRDAERDFFGVGADQTLILSVGRLAPQKNLGMVLDVASALRDRPGLRFAIVGEGPERPGLQARIDAEGLPVRLAGHRDNVASALRAADIVLLTSTWEARALVAQEALLAAVPLVSTRVGGIAELVGQAAVLIEPGDVAGMAAALGRLAEDPAERGRLADAGLQQAASWPDEDDVVTDLLTSYAEVVR